MNHYDWLDKNLEDFWNKVVHKERYSSGIISADGDKCYGYRDTWESFGIPFAHGVAIYLITKSYPYSNEVRQTANGWVGPDRWVIQNYSRFKEHLNPI